MPDETIVTRFVVEASEAIQRAQQWRSLVNDIKADLRALKETSTSSFRDLGKGMQEAVQSGHGLAEILQRYNLATMEAGRVNTYLSSAIRTATAEITQKSTAISGLESISKIAFGVGLGQVAVQAIRSFIGYIKEATEASYNFMKALFSLEVGVRALRRVGVDIVTPEVLENLDDLRKKFVMFSQTELIQGQAQLLNLVRTLGFTKEQIFNLTEAIVTLAVINNRSMEDVQRTVALALSSGYTEGLQRLGVSINRVTIAQKAAELGYKGNYMALTEQQRALATYALILEKVAHYSNDVAKYSETMAGKIDTAAASLRDTTREIGQQFLPFKKVWTEFLAFMTKGILTFIQLVRSMAAVAVMPFNAVLYRLQGLGITETVEQLMKDLRTDLENIWNTLPETLDSKAVGVAMGEDLASGIADGIKGLEDAVVTAMENLFRRIHSLERDYQNDIRDTNIKFMRDWDKIGRDLRFKLDSLHEDSLRKREERQKDSDNRIKNLTDKYNLDVLQTNRQFAIQAAEQEARYRERQLKAEIDFQEKLTKLREGFLFDLEDALRERDARQIIRLTRQYNLQKEQANREYRLQKDELARARQLEIAELQQRRAERLQVMAEDFQLRLQQIQAEAKAATEAEAAAERQRADQLIREAERQRDERRIRLEEELNDLDTHLQDRYNELVASFAEENKLTSEHLNTIADNWEKTYGPNSRLIAAVRYAVDYYNLASQQIANAAALQIAALSALQQVNIMGVQPTTLSPIRQANWGQAQLPTTTPSIISPYWKVLPFAGRRRRQEGGWLYAEKPTSMIFGETPELVHFMPLTGLGKDYNKLFVNPAGGGAGGRIEILLSLSPDLEGRIINSTLGMAANVMLEVQRRK